MPNPNATEIVIPEKPVVNPTPPSDPPRKRGLFWWIVLICLAVAGYFAWPRIQSMVSPKPTTPGAGAPGAARPVVAIPVAAEPARKGRVNVYINGLGLVTPLHTVTLKTRVDGQLMEVLYTEGQMVQKDQLLIQIDPRPYQVLIAQGEAQLNKDQALLDNANTDLARYQKLWSQNAIPQQQLATQQSLVKQYEATIKADQALIDASKLNLTYCRITAPITGRVGLRLIDPGNIVHASDNTGLVVIAQLQPISVIFPVAEDDLPAVQRGMRNGQQMPVEAWDRDITKRIASGTLVTIDNEIDQTTGTVKLRAQFENADNVLFPNQFINARLLAEQRTNITVVPLAAIQRNADSSYVYLIQDDKKIAVRPVKVGAIENDVAEVLSGLDPGELVVTDGVDKLQPGSLVAQRTDNRPKRATPGASTPTQAPARATPRGAAPTK